MAINFNTALGLEPQALMLREKRGEVLASNLANADTPDYKSRDMDFKSLLTHSLKSGKTGDFGLLKTDQGHMSAQKTLLNADLLYRNPQQPSLDGNTVETHIEQAKYTENAVQYQASLNFLKSDFSGLMTAIKGQ